MICEPRYAREMLLRAQKVRLILMDVDGVLTDGKIIYDTNSTEIKMYNAHDGLAITLARRASLKTGIISARESAAIRYRAEELKFDYIYLGQFYKIRSYENLKKSMKLSDEAICYVGDDLPDIPVLKRVGFPVAVQNASLPVKQIARFQTMRGGGDGAIREVVEYILNAQGRLENILEETIGEKIW